MDAENESAAFDPEGSTTRISKDWPQFSTKLARVLENLQEDQFLVMAVKQSDHYVQFAAQGAHGLRMETTGNQYRTKSAFTPRWFQVSATAPAFTPASMN